MKKARRCETGEPFEPHVCGRWVGEGKTARAKARPGEARGCAVAHLWGSQGQLRIATPDVFDHSDIVNIVNSPCGTGLT
jgi:hypothetical protein